MLHFIREEEFIDSVAETEYSLVASINPTAYPQVYDFYELVLVTSGELKINIGDKDLFLEQGMLELLCPGDVHTKTGEHCSYISLAFSSKIFDELMGYLGCDEQHMAIKSHFHVNAVHLSNKDYFTLKERMQSMVIREAKDKLRVRTSMRALLCELVLKFWKDALYMDREEHEALPEWLAEVLNAWNSSENRQKGLEFFCQYTGFSKEHLCRSFKKYLGVSPTTYLNKQRLNYAVGLMGNSRYSMIEIAFEAGFKSSSRFYHVFRETYGMSPKQFSVGKLQDGKEI